MGKKAVKYSDSIRKSNFHPIHNTGRHYTAVINQQFQNSNWGGFLPKEEFCSVHHPYSLMVMLEKNLQNDWQGSNKE